MTPVHPHACGEMCPDFGQTLLAIGSSPRVWGNENPLFGQQVLVRFIPTRVGK